MLQLCYSFVASKNLVVVFKQAVKVFCACPQGVLRMPARCFAYARKVVTSLLRPCYKGSCTLRAALQSLYSPLTKREVAPQVPAWFMTANGHGHSCDHVTILPDQYFRMIHKRIMPGNATDCAPPGISFERRENNGMDFFVSLQTEITKDTFRVWRRFTLFYGCSPSL